MKTRIAIAQINCTVGDLDGNTQKILANIQKAKDAAADIVIFPEMAVTGYPPEDLLLKPKFIADNLESIAKIARSVDAMIAIVGFVLQDTKGIYNSAAVINKGEVKGIYNKNLLPNYGVFDEKRYFQPGSAATIYKAGELCFGINICEDIWHKDGPIARQSKAGAGLIININSSPYHAGKIKQREDLIRREARANKTYIAYANLVGGQDELVFDGESMVVDPAGTIILRARSFAEDLVFADIEPDRPKSVCAAAVTVADTLNTGPKPTIQKRDPERVDENAQIYRALCLGLTDYVSKNGFSKVVLGLSGGIDSSLVATLAVDSLGKENVTGIYMPTRYSSSESEADARAVAENLGIKLISISIDHIYKLYLMALEQQFAGRQRDITEENIQARIRGTVIMALSNKFGWMVLTTGNKSEMSTGYATLYGDMAGGLAVIKDVPKTLVYKLAAYRNSVSKVIPDSVLTKEPTAELRAGQKDRDSLPPYEILDPIIKAYVEEDRSAGEVTAMGYDKDIVAKVIRLIDRSEYKRRQSPPGIKITPKAFGRDRRIPITNKYTL